MGLRNDGSRMFDYNGDPEISSVILFAKAEDRLRRKREDIEDLQNEYDLLNRQAFELYKSHVNYWKLDPSLIDKSRAWLKMKSEGKDADGNKLDGRKKYPEKDIYEYFTDLIKGYFGIDDLEIVGFIDFNFGQAWDVEFMSHGDKWYLEIPMVTKIAIKSFNNYGASCFKLSLHHYDADHITSYAGDTFVEEELKDIMAKAIEKYCKEETDNE